MRADAKLVYTYDVYWELSDISWASRWDAYLRMPGGRVHWFSILNSLVVVIVMSSIVAMIMMRTIRRDLQRYEGLLGETSACQLHHPPISICLSSMLTLGSGHGSCSLPGSSHLCHAYLVPPHFPCKQL